MCLILSIRGNKNYLNFPQHCWRRQAEGNRAETLEPLQAAS